MSNIEKYLCRYSSSISKAFDINALSNTCLKLSRDQSAEDFLFISDVGFQVTFQNVINSPVFKTICKTEREGKNFICLTTSFLEWGINKDVMKIDGIVLDSLERTDLPKELPFDIFTKVPTYCFFVDMQSDGFDGFFFKMTAILSDDKKYIEIHPMIVFIKHDGDDNCVCFYDFGKQLEETIKENSKFLGKLHGNPDAYQRKALNAVLYILSKYAEWEDGKKPSKPHMSKTRKHGMKFFPAQKCRTWTLGKETGDKIRKSTAAHRDQSSPRPHIRRGHWHGHWKGKMKSHERRMELMWHRPTVVNGSFENLGS